MKSMARHVGFMLEMQKMGAIVFDYGNNLREMALQGGEKNAYNFNGFIPEFIRPLFCDGKGPFRWAALSGDPEDIRMAELTCPSTGEVYYERVPPTISDCREALSWRFRVQPEQYTPAWET